MVTARVADLGGRGRSFPKEVRAAEHFGVFWGSRGHFREKTALPVWQTQTAKLGHFFAQHFIVDAKKRAGRSSYLINFIIQRWDYYGQPTSCFFMAGLPPISAKMSQNGGSNPGSNPFFSLRGGVLRVSGWCGAPHRRGAAPKENFSHQKRTFTPHFTYKEWVIRS